MIPIYQDIDLQQCWKIPFSQAPDMAVMAQKYWELANNLTAFAITQTVALVLAVAASHIPKKSLQDNWKLTIVLFAIGTLMYSIALLYCFEIEAAILCWHKAFKETAYARIGLVAVTNIFAVLWILKLRREPAV